MIGNDNWSYGLSASCTCYISIKVVKLMKQMLIIYRNQRLLAMEEKFELS